METPQPNKPNKNKFLIFLGAGFQMIAIIAICGYIGKQIDNHLQNKQPLITLAFLLFGTIGSLWQLIRQVNKINE